MSSSQKESNRPRTDPSFWNFGLLAPDAKLVPNGEIHLLKFEADELVHSSGITPGGKFFCFSRIGRSITTVSDPKTQIKRTVWSAPPEDLPIEVCFNNDAAFILDAAMRRLSTLSLITERIEETLDLACERLANNCQLEIAESRGMGNAFAVIGPTQTGRFVVRSLRLLTHLRGRTDGAAA